MKLESLIRSEAKLLLPTYERQPVFFTRGRGVYLWDANAKRYLDFLSGIGVNALGYGHPAIQATLKRQASRLIHVSNVADAAAPGRLRGVQVCRRRVA